MSLPHPIGDALIAAGNLAPAELERARLSPAARINRLCELNVRHQVANVCCTTFAQAAWRDRRPLAVHGWIYDIRDGRLHDLHVTVASLAEVTDLFINGGDR